MSAPEPSVSAAKREVLNGLAQALAALARRIQGQGEAAHQVGLLTAQAEDWRRAPGKSLVPIASTRKLLQISLQR